MFKGRNVNTSGYERRGVKTALVLSGGGAKGAYQVGVIKHLLKNGVKIELVTGSSIGAFNGALLSEFIYRGFSAKKIGHKLEEIWMDLENILKVNWQGIFTNLHSPANIPSIFQQETLSYFIKKYIPKMRCFKDYTKCQLSVTGTNLNTWQTDVFDFKSTISVYRAVLASMSFPAAFPPVIINQSSYVDGGAMANTPLSEALARGADNIYIVFLKPISISENEVNEDSEIQDLPAFQVIEELLSMAAGILMNNDLLRAARLKELIELINEYKKMLPDFFLKELKNLLGLKADNTGRLINVYKIAPSEPLNPPGLFGFENKRILKRLIDRGQKDAKKIYKLSCMYL